MLAVHFLDTESLRFDPEVRATVTEVARAAERQVRTHLPIVDPLHLLIDPSEGVIEATRDNATTITPYLIRWMVDPHTDVAQVAQEHLAKAFAHEAYHAARFRRLGEEATGRSWAEIAIGEGLATVYARDFAGADEPWSDYHHIAIAAWATELMDQPMDRTDMAKWKFHHPDNRQWIAYRVGTWLVDQALTNLGESVTDLVWTPASDIYQAAHQQP